MAYGARVPGRPLAGRLQGGSSTTDMEVSLSPDEGVPGDYSWGGGRAGGVADPVNGEDYPSRTAQTPQRATNTATDISSWSTPYACDERLFHLEQQQRALIHDKKMLQEELSYLKATVHKLAAVVEPMSLTDGGSTLMISGVNVKIVNGEGATDTANGKGNLIFGYEDCQGEVATSDAAGGGTMETTYDSSSKISSAPRFRRTAENGQNGHTSLLEDRSGSHNLIMGCGNSYSSYSCILNGIHNHVHSPFSSIFAGAHNTIHRATPAPAPYVTPYGPGHSCILTGNHGTIHGDRNAIITGHQNKCSMAFGTVVSGQENSVGYGGCVTAGRRNKVEESWSVCMGGQGNRVVDGAVYGVCVGGKDHEMGESGEVGCLT
ncbi:unnamed protein product [Vitrella brassicaformis CCMP3155]|uniref:Uncharacterized protein n=1 Tax=Vitrella brassicaformis (strain CCMP3155) TaxID=1169540 RepID=A0A0G4EDQ9_VITBC|nr:unnamed protein product [Vitrella brassicaformis CCMP3155]|eukprot:CEL93527.1 unnamed protein product [Vitrella brassicaformis CCMP3155]